MAWCGHLVRLEKHGGSTQVAEEENNGDIMLEEQRHQQYITCGSCVQVHMIIVIVFKIRVSKHEELRKLYFVSCLSRCTYKLSKYQISKSVLKVFVGVCVKSKHY